MPRKQIWSGAVLAAVAASSLTGCSLKASDGTPQSFAQLSSLSAQDAIQAATRAVTAHPSAKVHTVLTAPTGSETSDVVATFDEHPTLQGMLVMGSGGGAADPSAQSTPPIPIRYADNVMYMEMGQNPQLAAQMDGKAWLKMDLQAMAQDPNTAAVGSDVLENTSPSKGLILLAAAKDLHKVGAEQHGGVQTVHYAGALTGADATDPNLVGRGLSQQDSDVVADALAQGQVTKLGYDVWLRADGLPVAMTFTEVTPAGSLTGEIDYSDWGTPVAVPPVPGDQSADYMAMVKQAEAAQSSAEPSGAPSSSDGSSGSVTPSAPATPSSPGTPSSPATPSTSSTPSAPSPTGSSTGVPSTPTPTGSKSPSSSGSSTSSTSSSTTGTSTASTSAS
ncbi:hypothetical protein [Catenulispora pinisilvae]|uniref:hypothetical protein n=1 Tax=Catenulispora pinisilvae TaxID=2705253 RepID=UPI0018913B01|nr:hypothetical protein [Catenulispora pinisilvae]